MVQGAAAERRRRCAQSRALFLLEFAQCKLHLSLALIAQRGHALQRHVRPASGVVEGEGCPAAGTGRVGVGCARVDAEQARTVEDVAALQHARHEERLEADATLLGGGGARPRPLESRGGLAQRGETKVGVDRLGGCLGPRHDAAARSENARALKVCELALIDVENANREGVERERERETRG